MPISKPHSSLGSKNTGSCTLLANYLDKENRELESKSIKQNSLSEIKLFQNRKQDFFNHSRDDIGLMEVITSIDSNKKKLGKNDAKYFSPTISFSQAELAHLISLATNKKGISDVWQLSSEDFKKYNALLQGYIKKVMDNYAENFNRQSKGLKTGEDLLYYAKIEHFRKFKGTDPEVQKGLYKNGHQKPNLNTHAHILISRKDKTQRMKLSPIANERSKDRMIGDNKYHVGFDRMKWIEMNEKTFDLSFRYRRLENEKFRNQYILKNGSPKEKDLLTQKIKQQTLDKGLNLKNERRPGFRR